MGGTEIAPSPCPISVEPDADYLQKAGSLESCEPHSYLTTICDGLSVNDAQLTKSEDGEAGKGSNKFCQEPERETGSSSFVQPRAHSTATERKCLPVPKASVWQRLKWGLILSLGGKKAYLDIPKEELKPAMATTMEVTIMGSALVLTLGLQIQEVIGGRGGFRSQDGLSLAQVAFAVSSSLSFALAMYSIITSSVLLLSFSTCPSRHGRPPGMPRHIHSTDISRFDIIHSFITFTYKRHAERMLRKFFGWLCTPKLCTLSAAICLGIAALAGNFLGVDRSIAILSTLITGIGLLLTLAAIFVIISLLRQFQREILDREIGSSFKNKDLDQNEHQTPLGGASHKNECDAKPGQVEECAKPQQLLSPLTPMSTAAGVSFRISQVPVYG